MPRRPYASEPLTPERNEIAALPALAAIARPVVRSAARADAQASTMRQLRLLYAHVAREPLPQMLTGLVQPAKS